MGHDWEIAGAVNTALNTVSVKCKVCKTGKTGVSVVAGTVHDGEDCKDYTYTPYTTTGLDNGLASTHANYNGNVVLTANVKDETAPLHHVLGKGTAYEITGLELGEKVEYNDRIAAALASGQVRWIAGMPATCSTYKSAVLDCSVCGNPFVINVSGEHTLGVETFMKGNCVEGGYTYKVCSEDHDAVTAGVQTKEIIFDYIDAKEHNYEVVPATESAFIAGTANTITIKCACGDRQVLSNPVPGAVIPGTSACNPADTTPYTFTYSYDVTNNDGVDTINEEFVLYRTSSAPSHKIVVEGFDALDDITLRKKFTSNDMWEAALASGQVRWVEGVPIDCNHYSQVVFDCADCGHPIVVELSGKHDVREGALVTGVKAMYDDNGVLVGFDYGQCVGECSDCGAHDVAVFAEKFSSQEILEMQACCKNTTVVIEYKYNGKIVAVKEVVVTKGGEHVFNGSNFQREETEGGKTYVCTYYYCDEGKQYVIVSKEEKIN